MEQTSRQRQPNALAKVFGQGRQRGHERPRVAEQALPRYEASRALPTSYAYNALRRGLDIVSASIALGLFAAILPLVALAIRIDSPGPIFYAQKRVGMNRRRRERRRVHRTVSLDERRKVIYPGKPFTIFKLRSMRNDAESNGPQLAGANDARITRVGLFLRMSRLDEVPQFWNVLKGEMSLIGPRPERLHFIRQYEPLIPGYSRRLGVLPGITGLAQVQNGYDEDIASVKRKVALDRCYMRQSGFLVDLRILLSTVRVVLTGDGAR